MTWLTRLTWLLLPVTLGDLLGAAVAGSSDPVGFAAAALCWGLWAAGLLASLVQQPWALLTLRIVAPLAVLAAALAATQETPQALGWVGIVLAAVAAVAAMSADVGHECVNGASYGDEERFPLRPPAVLLFGPIALVWALTALPLPAAVLALAARQWALGAALVLVGVPAAWWGVRVLTRLTRRWCVFVPAGVTLVDDMAVAEPTLIRGRDIVAVRPAPADTTALDLSAAASGLIVQIDLNGEGEFVPAPARGGIAEPSTADAVLIAPSRPGRLIRHAQARGLGVSHETA